MQNDAGQPVDLYIPRKCSWTSRLLAATDKGAVQINVGMVDPETGRYTKTFHTFALSGYIRHKAEGDMAMTELVRQADTQAGLR
eukprot:CAMPEP_0198423864 /NCGR_PEP_ID=MMETSP1452-20131203/3427_1 /TAXON_ID=1181717 /ORGANISM="Synchroma pusillum, Strain CCMP3072" /LENGTH=83 /DNA_ID=CAMNT_0044144187 /DNA_START=57 /DNA_END=308 /DNA_ORIENTATION=+